MRLPQFPPALTGEDMRAMRRGVGLSQCKLAMAMGYSPQMIKAWEHEEPFMPDHAVVIFMDVIMNRQAERETLMKLVLITKHHVCDEPIAQSS